MAAPAARTHAPKAATKAKAKPKVKNPPAPKHSSPAARDADAVPDGQSASRRVLVDRYMTQKSLGDFVEPRLLAIETPRHIKKTLKKNLKNIKKRCIQKASNLFILFTDLS